MRIEVSRQTSSTYPRPGLIKISVFGTPGDDKQPVAWIGFDFEIDKKTADALIRKLRKEMKP